MKVPLDKVNEAYTQEWEPIHRRTLAEHYGIYRDLFNGASFTPSLNASITFDYDDEYVTPVHRGNIILPAEVSMCDFLYIHCYLYMRLDN